MKKILYLIIIILIIVYYLWFPSEAFQASKLGILLWFNQILPTLLPFTILSAVILGSNLFSTIDYQIQKLNLKLPISITEFFIIFFGFLFGFPIGSKLTADYYEHTMIKKESAQILCSFTNNLSPIFVISYVLNQQFKGAFQTIPTLLILYGPPFVIGTIQLLYKNKPKNSHKKTASRFQINMQIVDAGIISGFTTLIKLCGYIVMFSIIGSMATHISWKYNWARTLVIGNLEVTNGIALLSHTNHSNLCKYLFSIMILSLGGLSGIVQTGSMISGTNLSLHKYVLHKMIYCLCSVILGFGYFYLFV